jgi:hypothetical protein
VRKPVRLGHADARVGRRQLALGHANVRPARQHVAGVADRQRRVDRMKSLRRKVDAQLARSFTEQHGQPERVRLRLGLQRRQLRLDRGQARAGAGHILIRAGADFRAAFDQLERIAQVVDIAARDIDAQLGAAQIEVMPRHFGEQRDLRILQRRGARFGIGARGFHGSTNAAEQIQLPAGVETGLVGRDGFGRAGEAGLLFAAAGVARLRLNVRHLLRLRGTKLRPRLVQPCQRDLQIGAVFCGALDQCVERGIVELRPPVGLKIPRRLLRGIDALQRHRLFNRTVIVRADGDAAGEEQRARKSAQTEKRSHLSVPRKRERAVPRDAPCARRGGPCCFRSSGGSAHRTAA